MPFRNADFSNVRNSVIRNYKDSYLTQLVVQMGRRNLLIDVE
mgnify:CR=1 FL=1